MVVMPGPAGLGQPRPRRRAQLVVGRGPRRLDRGVDAAGGVRRAGHAGGELGAAVAGEHEVGVAVDEAGDHARARRRRCARRPAGAGPVPTATTTPSSITTWASASSPCVGVRDEQADAVDDDASSRQHRSAARRRRRCAVWRAVAHDDAPADRRRGARRPRWPRTRRRASASSAPVPAVRTESRRDRRQVGQARRPRCARRRASRGWRGRARSPSAAAPRRRGGRARRVARRSSSSTARASSSRSMTACESLPSVSRAPASRRANVGPMPSARSRSVVGQRQHEHRRRAEQPDVGRREVGGVDGGEPLRRARRRRRAARSASRPWAASTCSFSAGCSDTWACSGAPRSPAHASDDGDRRRVDGAHRVDGGADRARPAPSRSSPTRVGPRVGVAVGEPLLRGVELDARAAAQVARVEQRDPDAGLAGRGDERVGHRVRRRRTATPPGAWCR